MTRRRSRYFLDPPAGAAAAPCAGAGNLRPPPCPTRPASKVTAPRGRGSREAAGPSAVRRGRLWSGSGCDGPDHVPGGPVGPPPRNRQWVRENRAVWLGTGPSRGRPGPAERLSSVAPVKEIVAALGSFEKQTNPTAVGCLPDSPDCLSQNGSALSSRRNPE